MTLLFMLRVGTLERFISLLEAGADPNSYSENHRSILGEAIYGMHTDKVAALIRYGADIRMPVTEGACSDSSLANSSPLYTAARCMHFGAAKLLLDGGVDPNIHWPGGDTPLRAAVISKSVELVKLLLSYGANVHQAVRRMSLLHTAIGTGSLELVDCLLKNGTDPNTPLWMGEPPIAAAARRGLIDIVKLFVDSGELQLESLTNIQILAKAAARGFADIVEVLLCAGVRHISRRSSPNPLYRLSQKKNRKRMIALLCVGKIEILDAHMLPSPSLLYDAQVRIQPIQPQWEQFFEISFIFARHVGSVYEVLWIAEFVAAYEMADKSSHWLHLRPHCGAFEWFVDAMKSKLPEFKRVRTIQSIMDVKRTNRV